MKPKTMILMVVAVGCGLGASFMTSRYLKAAKSEPQEAEPTVPVLVAKARIPAWTPIKKAEELFEVKQYPQSVAPRRALTDLSDVREQRLRNALEAGKPVTQDDLLTKEQMSIAENLKPGQRAIAIKVTPESVVSGFVLPGTRVDVMCTTRGQDPQSKVILQNMLVLAVDQQDQRGAETKAIIGQNVTLAATPEEAGRLTLGASLGELRLMLKSQTDTTQVAPVITRWRDLDTPPGSKPAEPDELKEEAPPKAPDLPPLPPEEDPKPEAKADEQPEAKPAAPKLKPHVMKLITGATVEKVTFRPVIEEVEETEDTPPASPGAAAKPQEKPQEKKKDAPAPQMLKKDAAKPAGPGSAFSGRSTRVGRP